MLLLKIVIANLKRIIARLKIYVSKEISFSTYSIKSKIAKKLSNTILKINKGIMEYFKNK